MATTTVPGKLERPDQNVVRARAGARERTKVPSVSQGKAVVVHSGARDAYQVARALDERGLLECLVTDLYWPADRPWAARLFHLLPASLRTQLLQRTEPALRSRHVHPLTLRGIATLLPDKLRRVPFAWRRGMMRQTDAALGAYAGRRARRTGATLLSYSYYGYHAFAQTTAPGMLFQLHPHPASMRRILRAELAAHPDCAQSLGKEWELALPEQDFTRLVEEPQLAAHILAASSFTRDTLVENGTPADRITVVPYGVDCARFSPSPHPRQADKILRLLFVGRINQRKGIKYLLEALRLLDRRDVHLSVCGRVVDSLDLFKPFAGQVDVQPDVTHEALVAAYRQADLFVFPSVAEGFGQVLLEALACGLPILSTTHTAAPDLIDDGLEGWIVPPARPDLLAERIAWACSHREELATMRSLARSRAEEFTWARFRQGIAAAFSEFAARQQEARRV
jgi:glycosyltransferase involved in cell wall biosynthesis